MKKTIVLAALTLLAPLATQAADYPINFGEIKNGVVIPGRTLKMCAKSTGYTYGFEILLPEKGTHEVSGDFRWPTDANCSSCAHAMDSYGKHAGRYMKRLTFDGDEKPGDYSLTVIVDHEPVTTVKFKVEAAANCP
jgi:hypothetical protein